MGYTTKCYYWETPPWLSNPSLFCIPFLTEEVPPEGQKARNTDRTRIFTKAEWFKSTSLTIFVAIFYTQSFEKPNITKTMGNLEKEMAAKLWWKQLLPNVLWCMMSTIFARWLTEIKSFFLQKQFPLGNLQVFEISFGTRTSKSDLLQKITEMVVEGSCVVKSIVGKDATRRKTTLPRWVCTLPIITHFSSARSLWIHCPSGKSPA